MFLLPKGKSAFALMLKGTVSVQKASNPTFQVAFGGFMTF
jgi:hypothetical protein